MFIKAYLVEVVITTMMTTANKMTPMIIHILMFSHQYFLLSLTACCWNWEAPSWRSSALRSSSEIFWSRSRTFSTLTLMISTTSPTWACACWSLFEATNFWIFGGGPEVVGGAAGAPLPPPAELAVGDDDSGSDMAIAVKILQTKKGDSNDESFLDNSAADKNNASSCEHSMRFFISW